MMWLWSWAALLAAWAFVLCCAVQHAQANALCHSGSIVLRCVLLCSMCRHVRCVAVLLCQLCAAQCGTMCSPTAALRWLHCVVQCRTAVVLRNNRQMGCVVELCCAQHTQAM
jgi:hypothetical protein